MSSGFENTMHFLEGWFCQLDKTSFASPNLFKKACFRLKETFFSEGQVNLTHIHIFQVPSKTWGYLWQSIDNLKQPRASVSTILTTNVINPLATFLLILSGLEKEKPFLSDFPQYHFVCNYTLTCNTSCCTSFKWEIQLAGWKCRNAFNN